MQRYTVCAGPGLRENVVNTDTKEVRTFLGNHIIQVGIQGIIRYREEATGWKIKSGSRSSIGSHCCEDSRLADVTSLQGLKGPRDQSAEASV